MNLFLSALAVSLVGAAEFEAPPAAFQTWPRPADGETVAANPPCFVYPATEVHDAYVVEVSSDPQFAPARTQVLSSPWMLAVPDQPLPAGTYHWRWRPGRPGDGGRVWSEVRTFTVPADIPTVPFPSVDELVRRIGTARPRVYVTAADLEPTRQLARTELGDGYVASVHAAAERARDKELLPEPDFLPEPGDPHRIEIYQKTFQTTRPFFSEARGLAEGYLLTGDELAGQEAKRRLLHVVSWDPQGSTSLGHNDEPGTEVVRYFPIIYDWIYPLLDAADKRKCLDCFAVRMNEMMDRWRRRPFEKYPYESHNMGYYLPDLLGASLALAGEAPVEEMLHYTMLQLWSPFYPPYGDADGGWNEGPSYWGWTAAVVAHSYLLVERATGVPIKLRSNLRNQVYYKLYGNPPYFQMSPFGDGQEGAAGNGHVMYLLAALYHNPSAKWWADQQNARPSGLDALLFRADDLPAEAPYDLPQSRCFHDVGLACLHSVLPDPSSNVALLFRSCPFGGISHAYADQNTFALDAYGEPLIIASGYYQLYGHPHHQEWTRQTKASNSVLVDGQGQQRTWDAKGRIAEFSSTVAGDYVVGDATAAYAGLLKRFDRRLVYLRPMHTGGEPVVVIHDELEAPQPATYQFLLQALEQMTVDDAKQEVTIARGDARCRVDYLAPAGLSFEQNDRFPQPPFRSAPDQWHLTASTATPATTASSVIVLQPHRAGQAAELLQARTEPADGGLAVVLSGAGREITVVYRNSGAAEVKVGRRATDAAAASWCTTGGTSVSAAMFDGTRLTDAGQVRLSASRPAGASWSSRGEGALTDGPDGVQVTGAEAGPANATLTVDATDVAFAAQRHPRVGRTVLETKAATAGGHHEVRVALEETAGHPAAAVLAVGSATARVEVQAHGKAELTVPAVAFGPAEAVSLMLDEARGGRLAVRSAEARRVYGVELLPNGSFEQATGGVPALWRAGTITQDAQCELASAPGGHTGERCLQVTCTKATGGDFGALLTWPGIAPVPFARRFRMSCWVKTDAMSVAGLQVTSRDWRWWKNTDRLGDKADWTEAALEFELPANQDLSWCRLHLNAKQDGAVLLIDDVSLTELPPG